MMRSLYAGVSGLRNHQVKMDVIGNNIANVNTVGFKRGRVNFQDMLYQTMSGASSPQGDKGGTNATQVGLGVGIASIDNIQTQGSLQTTGKNTDVAIQGDGFFVLGEGADRFYTRSGLFDLDKNGDLINAANGMKVMGWTATNGTINTDPSQISGITVPIGADMAPKATDTLSYANNLDAGGIAEDLTATPPVIGTTYTTNMDVYDSLGNAHTIAMEFKKTGVNQWDWKASVNGTALTVVDSSNAVITNPRLTFDSDGLLSSTTPASATIQIPLSNGATTTLDITPDFSKITQYASPSSVEASDQNGNPPGSLRSFAVDQSGVISGIYSNGFSEKIGQLALANFANPGGLTKTGENLYKESNNSGDGKVGVAGAGGRGSITPGALEMSNVDLSQEFTDMIVTQRGFQANSRVITTSDEMLQELVNLKR